MVGMRQNTRQAHERARALLNEDGSQPAEPIPITPTPLPQAPRGRRSRALTVALILGMGLLFIAFVAGIVAMWLLVEPAGPR